MHPEEGPATCTACGIALLPRSARRLGTFVGVELGFGLLLVAAAIPFGWAQVLCGSGGATLLIHAYAAGRERNVGLCPRCGTGPPRTERGAPARGADPRRGG